MAEQTVNDRKFWYVINSKPRKEAFLLGLIESRNLECYYPVIKVPLKRRRAFVYKPYFPGYFFVRLDLGSREDAELRWLPGLRKIVSYGDEPTRVHDSVVASIKAHLEDYNARETELQSSLKRGDRVKILDGPFSGYEAIYDTGINGSQRAKVLLKMLNDRSLAVEVFGSEIRKISK